MNWEEKREELKEYFLSCSGNLEYLPERFKKWKILSYYRNEWDFLPSSLRDRVAEQLLFVDYILSLGLWLKPKLVSGEKHRVLIAQLIASIYESILDNLLEKKFQKKSNEDALFKEVLENSDKYGSIRTFGPVRRAALKAEFLNSTWSTYMGYMNEIRNWLHLTRKQEANVMKWLTRRSAEDLRKTLDQFRIFIRRKYQENNIPF